MNDKNLKRLSWVAAVFSLVGTIFAAYKIIWCWPIYIIGNFFWIYWSFKKKEWAQLVLWSVFQIANCFAWYQWWIK